MRALRQVLIRILAVVAVAAAGTCAASALDFGQGPLNRPYTDGRAWHLGFSVGLHVQDARLSHEGLMTDDGRTWFLSQPSYSPGFCVGGLVDFRFNDYFNLRISPGLWFGNRNIRMIDTQSDEIRSQNVKSTFVVLPIDVKFSSVRYRNARPYLTAGVMPAFDVAKKRVEALRFKQFDTYLTVGIGCDFYLPYFKLNPELKFCFGLIDVLQHNRPDLADDPANLDITRSLRRVSSRMLVLTFYFE